MTWQVVGCPKTVLVTKELAKEYAEMEPAPQDRPLSERRLGVYEKLFKAGQFRPVTWAKAFCKETGGTYRVNGKHTSTMFSGMETLPEFYVTIEEYFCQTLEDVAKLYATFDSNMQSRNANDIYRSFAATCPELRDIDTKVIQCCAGGIAMNKYGQDAYGKTQPAERAELLLEHSDFVVWLANFISQGPNDNESGVKRGRKCAHILRVPVAAAIFACYQKDQKAANTFWSAVRDETGKSPECPDRKVAKYLMVVSMKNVQTNRGSNKLVATNREVYVRCLHGWNAWRANKPTKLQYYPEAELPDVR